MEEEPNGANGVADGGAAPPDPAPKMFAPKPNGANANGESDASDRAPCNDAGDGTELAAAGKADGRSARAFIASDGAGSCEWLVLGAPLVAAAAPAELAGAGSELKPNAGAVAEADVTPVPLGNAGVATAGAGACEEAAPIAEAPAAPLTAAVAGPAVVGARAVEPAAAGGSSGLELSTDAPSFDPSILLSTRRFRVSRDQ